jgi:hypothetical protein
MRNYNKDGEEISFSIRDGGKIIDVSRDGYAIGTSEIDEISGIVKHFDNKGNEIDNYMGDRTPGYIQRHPPKQSYNEKAGMTFDEVNRFRFRSFLICIVVLVISLSILIVNEIENPFALGILVSIACSSFIVSVACLVKWIDLHFPLFDDILYYGGKVVGSILLIIVIVFLVKACL